MQKTEQKGFLNQIFTMQELLLMALAKEQGFARSA